MFSFSAFRELVKPSFRNLLVLGASSMAFTGLAADASADCDGCSVYLPTTSAGSNECWTIFWSASGTGGACVWSAPNCYPDGQCEIDVTWTVVPALGAPASCPPDAVFDWSTGWNGNSSGSGSVSAELSQSLQNLRLACGTNFVLVVSERATGAAVGTVTILCTACSA